MEGKVHDVNLAALGTSEIELAKFEMPGLVALMEEYASSKPLAGVRISGSLHMTVQTAVLIETLHALGASLRWCSCNIFSTQNEAAASVLQRGLATVFAWKGETIPEYWWCTNQALTWGAEDLGPDLIVDDGADMTMLIHEGVRYEKMWEERHCVPDCGVTEDEVGLHELIMQTLESHPRKWRSIAAKIRGVSEETTTGVHRLIALANSGKLLFPAINVNDCVTKSKFDNIYGCRHSLLDGIYRATDMMLGGKKALVCGFGDVGKGCAQALKGAGARVYVSEIDPICALQAMMEGFSVVTVDEIVGKVDVCITTTGNKNIIMAEHMSKMKNNVIVGNIGHFDNEIDMTGLSKIATRENVKPQHDVYRFPDNKIIHILAEGRLLNLGCATGHPSFVMSCSFSNQTLAQINLWANKESYKSQVHSLPKHLDEKVARIHVEALGGHLTHLTPAQSEYIGVPVNGPYKPESYRY